MYNNFPNVKPFRFWVQSVLPLVYDDSLSYYEVLAKLSAKINEIIAELGTVPDEMYKIIQDYLNSEEFKSELEKYIQEYEEQQKWYNSGTIDVHRIFRRIETSSIIDPQNPHYVYAQSCCYNENTNTLLVIYIPASGALNYDEYGLVIEYSMTDYSVVRETIIPCYHANGIDFNKNTNEIYVCGLNQNEQEAYLITVFDYETLNVKYTKEFNAIPVAVAFDGIGEIYVRFNNDEVQVFDTSFKPIRGFFIESPDARGNVKGDMTFYDGMLYCMNWRPNTINAYDRTGKNVANYNVPEWWSKYYRAHECEGLTWVGNDYFVITGISSLSTGGYQNMTSVGKISFKLGEVNDETGFGRIDLGASAESAMNIYVDTTVTNINPTGSQESPFSSVQEAIESCHSPFIDRTINIFLNGQEPYILEIRGVNHLINFVQAYTFRRINIYDNYRVSFGGQVVNGDNTYGLDLLNSDVVLNSTRLSGSYGIHAVRSKITAVGYSLASTPTANIQASEMYIGRDYDTTKLSLIDTDCTVNQGIDITPNEVSLSERFTPRLNVLRFEELSFDFRIPAASGSMALARTKVKSGTGSRVIFGTIGSSNIKYIVGFQCYVYDNGDIRILDSWYFNCTEGTVGTGFPPSTALNKIYGYTS